MKVGRSSHGLTFLILRDSRSSALQLYLSKPIMVYVPIAALVSISSLILSLHLRAEDRIAGLEHQLVQQQITMEAVVSDKNEALRRLQSQVTGLTQESLQFQQRLGTVSELQQQLETFLQENKIQVTEADVQSAAALSARSSPAVQVGGEFIAVYDTSTDTDTQIQDTEDDFAAMNLLLNQMASEVPAQIHAAEARLEAISGTISLWPTPSKRITSSFGYRSDPFTEKGAFHAGIDIGGSIGDPVYAAAAGKVTAVQKDGSRGEYIIIRHPGGLETWYMHLSEALIKEGETVVKGQTIGRLGNTGRSTGPHLHFQVMKNSDAVNPLPYIQ